MSGLEARHAKLRTRLAALANMVRSKSGELHIVFVTNLRHEPLADLGPEGVLNLGQYYTRTQADSIIQNLQASGASVESFFTEESFIEAAVRGHLKSNGRTTIVYTAAEGGTGSGRRALIPSFCALLGLPVLNSGAHACSVARHKFHSQAIFDSVGIRSPATWLFGSDGWLDGQQPSAGTKVILKPTYESDAIGVSADSVAIVDDCFERLAQDKFELFGQVATVQEFITGVEIGVGLVRIGSTLALPIVEFCRRDGSEYGAEAKTFQSESIEGDFSYRRFEAVPATYESCQRAAIRAFNVLEMSGVGRMDFRVDPDGRAWLFDAGEAPPPTVNSAFAFALEQLGFDIEDMLAIWIGACLVEYGLV